MLLLLLVPGLLLCAYLIWVLCWVRAWRVDTKVPIHSGGIPLFGHYHVLPKSGDYLWEKIKSASDEANKLGGVMKIWVGPIPFYFITDPDVALKLSNTCMQKHYFYSFFESWLGNGLVTVRDEKTWQYHRKLLNPTFNQRILDGFLEVFNSQAVSLNNILSVHAGKDKFNHVTYLTDNSLEIVCRSIFGIPAENKDIIDQEYKNAVAQNLELSIERFLKLWLHLNWVYKYSDVKNNFEKTCKVLKNMSLSVIQRQKSLSKNSITVDENQGRKFKTFLELLLELGEEGSLTEQEIREEVDTMIMAGHDTTATSMTYLLVALGSYPEVQQKVYEEIIEVMGDEHRYIEKDDLRKLVYTEAVIKESLRLYTTAPVYSRVSSEDVNIDDKYTIPRGCSIFISTHGIHRNTRVWGADAHVFRPERWLQAASLPASAAAFAAFSVGRRTCIGKIYAMMSMKTVVAHLLRRYIIRADDKQMTFKFEVMLKPKSGHHISIEERIK